MSSSSSFQVLCAPRDALVLSRTGILERLSRNSAVSMSSLATCPKVRRDELCIESALGKGTFSVVYRVRYQGTLAWNDDSSINSAGTPSDSDSDRSSTLHGTSYAMKCLSPLNFSSPEKFLAAATSFYYEASILAQLDHPNIIRLRGMPVEGFCESFGNTNITSNGGVHSTNNCKNGNNNTHGYFLALDLLQGTLRNRLDTLREEQSRFFRVSNHGNNTDAKSYPDGDRRSLSLWSGKLKIASEIAHAMTYLHSKQIVFRDLKPESVGFDAHDGSVKLFDFGAARPLVESFTAAAVEGSFRYMAPEDMLCQPSGFPADVYSYGVLLWELSTLELPYDSFVSTDKSTRQEVFSQSKFTSQVILKGWRPETDSIACPATKEVIEQCWDANPKHRPLFDDIAGKVTSMYQVHRAQREKAESMTTSKQRPSLLKSNSFTFRSRAGTGESRVPRRGFSMTISNVDRRRTGSNNQGKQTLSQATTSRLEADTMPTIDSTSDDQSSSSFQIDDMTPNSPLPARKTTDSLGQTNFRQAPFTRKQDRTLSTPSRRTLPIGHSEELNRQNARSSVSHCAPMSSDTSNKTKAERNRSKPKSDKRLSSSPFSSRCSGTNEQQKEEGEKKSKPRRTRSLRRNASATGKLFRSLSGSLHGTKKKNPAAEGRSSGTEDSEALTSDSSIIAVDQDWSSESFGSIRHGPSHRKGVKNMVRATLEAAELSASRHADQ